MTHVLQCLFPSVLPVTQLLAEVTVACERCQLCALLPYVPAKPAGLVCCFSAHVRSPSDSNQLLWLIRLKCDVLHQALTPVQLAVMMQHCAPGSSSALPNLHAFARALTSEVLDAQPAVSPCLAVAGQSSKHLQCTCLSASVPS